MRNRLGVVTVAVIQSTLISCSAEDGVAVRQEALDAAVKAEEFRKITSVLVSYRGELVSESYWAPGAADYLNNTRSATKSLTAMAVGAAIADGAITDVDAPAFSWFETERPFRFSTELKEQITVSDLLTMSSALDCDDNEWSTPGNEEHMYPARRWTFFTVDLPTKEDYRRDERGYGPFSYCTAGVFLLGQIIERATGEPVDEYVERRLLKPLGVDRVRWHRSPSGEIMTGGGTELTSRALLKLADLALDGGTRDDERVLPASWVREMTTARVTAREGVDYGYLWWRQDFACGGGAASGWFMSGNGGNKVVVFRELELAVVITAQLYGTRGMHQQSTDIIEKYVLPGVPACSS